MVYEWAIYGLAGAFGSLAKSLHGWFNTTSSTKFNAKLFFGSFLPTAIVAFGAYMYLNVPYNLSTVVTVFLGAYGLNTAVNKLDSVKKLIK